MSILGVLGGQAAAELDHQGAMAEIHARGAQRDADNIYNMAVKAAQNAKVAVEEGRAQANALKDDTEKLIAMVEPVQASTQKQAENTGKIADALGHLTELVKLDLQQNQLLAAQNKQLATRLSAIEQKLDGSAHPSQDA